MNKKVKHTLKATQKYFKYIKLNSTQQSHSYILKKTAYIKLFLLLCKSVSKALAVSTSGIKQINLKL